MPGVLVDTSVWVDHLRASNPELSDLMRHRQCRIHPLVIGELSCGNLKDRAVFLKFLTRLPPGVQATHAEALRMLELARLHGRGLSWVDVHLLTSARIGGLALWSRDKRLAKAAEELGCGWRG